MKKRGIKGIQGNKILKNLFSSLMVFLICVGMFLNPMTTFASSNTNYYTYKIVLPTNYNGTVSYSYGGSSSKFSTTSSRSIVINSKYYDSLTVYVKPSKQEGVSFQDSTRCKYLNTDVSKDGTWSVTVYGNNAARNSNGEICIYVDFGDVPYLYKGSPVWKWNNDKAVATFTKTNGNPSIVNMEATVSTQDIKNSCTAVKLYTASVFFMGKKYSSTRNVTTSLSAHTYSLPYIQFSENGKSAKLLKKCTKCGYTETLSQSVAIKSTVVKNATYIEKGKTQYTATTTYNGKVYRAYKTLADIPKLQKSTVSLKTGSKVFVKGTLTQGENLYKLELNRFGSNRAVFVNSDGVEVEGTLNWQDSSLTPDVGQQSVTWYFRPSDPAYCTLTGNIVITVLENPDQSNVTDAYIKLSETGTAKFYIYKSGEWTELKNQNIQVAIQYLGANSSTTYQIKYTATTTYNGKVYSDTKIVEKAL